MTLDIDHGTWTVDTAHSGVEFSVRHLGLARVRGRFNRFEGTLEVGPELEGTTLSASIDMTSVDTNNADRDNHLRSTDFFSVDNHPTMDFRSTAIKPAGGGAYVVTGDLTINGVTQPIELEVEFHGTQTFPMDGSLRSGFSASGDIRRSDFGIDFDVPVGEGLMLGDKVTIEIDAQLVHAEASGSDA
jgi:polyisoprenoid-binding protein YceI